MMRKRLFVLCGAIAYVTVLTNVYIERVSPVFAYEGSKYTPPPDGVQPISWLLALLPALWMPTALKRPSQVVYWFLYLVVYVPACLLTIFSLTMAMSSVLVFLCCLAVCFWGLDQIYRLPLLPVSGVRILPFWFWLGLSLFSLLCYGLIISASGLRFAFVSLEDVYSLRADFTAVAAQYGPWLIYVVTWQVGVVNPLLTALGLSKRNLGLLTAGVAGQLLMYSITGLRTALFSSAVLVLMVTGLRGDGKWFGPLAVWTVLGMMIAAVYVDQLTDSITATAIVVNRTLAIPGLLTGYYLEFFSDNPQALLGDSIFHAFVTYPYAVGVPSVIGDAYMHGADANANVWADAYAQFGYVGLFVFTLLLAGVLHVFDSVAVGHDQTFTGLLGATIGWTLANGALLTSLLTGGIGLLIFVLAVMPRVRRYPAPIPAGRRQRSQYPPTLDRRPGGRTVLND
jgi:hypothetical protein